MSDRTIYINSETCGDDKCLVIFNDNGQKNGETKLKKKQKITFVNGLETPAELKFYEQLGGVVSTNPITDFCKDESTNPLQVTLFKKCFTTKNPGTYKFTVDASGYKSLDPVIIIEPGVISFLNLALLLALLAAAFGAFRWFRKS